MPFSIREPNLSVSGDSIAPSCSDLSIPDIRVWTLPLPTNHQADLFLMSQPPHHYFRPPLPSETVGPSPFASSPPRT